MSWGRHRRLRSPVPVAVLAVVATLALFGALGWGQRAADADTVVPATATSAEVSPSAGSVPPPTVPVGEPVPSLADQVENVVFVLADDLDWETFKQVPRLAALQQSGTTFTNTVVTDSLCCPSRVSILRSQYVHNHRVVSNRELSGGGWPTFHGLGEEADCLPVWLDTAGVQTALVGKYLNEYPNGAPSATYIPPGWDHWVVPVTQASAYRGYGYVLNENGTLQSYGDRPRDFLGDVLIDNAVSFVDSATSPFYLQLSLMNPHNPSPVSPRHKADNPDAQIPRTPVLNAKDANEPPWRATLPGIGPARLDRFDAEWVKRVQSTQTVADAVEEITAALARTGKLDSTLIVVGSDNGYHAGARRLPMGKRTPYREDTVVPLIFIGPGITEDRRVDALTSTIDLAPTFAELLGATTPAWADGRSLVPLLEQQATVPWRTGILSESLGESSPGDPDYQTLRPPKFAALRTDRWLYVEYVDGERELYDLLTDPYEIRNVIDSTSPFTVFRLHEQLNALRICAGPTCRTADTMAT